MNNTDNMPRGPKGGRLAFGILMILVYLGMGLFFIFNVLNISPEWVAYVIGALLIVYGIWRCIRLYKGWG